MRKLLYILFIVLVSANAILAQTGPYVSGFDKKITTVNDTVVISGLNFSNDPTELQVNFGAGAAQIVSSSESTIKVLVPTTATYGPVIVTNLTTGLSGFSPDNFYISFGESNYTSNGLRPLVDFPTGQQSTYDICACDFNSDGLNDIAVSNQKLPNSGEPGINIFTNTSTLGTPSFERADRALFPGNILPTINTTCGDLDGDGKADLLFSDEAADVARAANNIVVMHNTSGAVISFENAVILTIPNKPNGDFRDSRRIAIDDLDNDGKPDVIVTNSADQFLYIYRNTSTIGTISLDTSPLELEVLSNETGLVGLDIADLNSDGQPEILVTQFQSSNFYFFENRSIPGTFNFQASTTVMANGSFLNIKAGDIDGDNRNDIALINPINSRVSVLLNNGQGSSISFGNQTDFDTNERPWGLDFGDLNGDGLMDIAIPSLSFTDLAMTTLINTTNNGVIGFDRVDINTNSNSRNVKITDLDNDGRVDLAFTADATAEMSVVLNKNCITPTLTPVSQTVCSGIPFRLSTYQTATGTYTWFRDGEEISGAADHFIEVTQSGSYTVQLTMDGTGCSILSAPSVINVAAGTNVRPVINPVGPTCLGETITLQSSTPGTTFIWRGPDGFSEIGNPVLIEDFNASKAGTYYLSIQSGSCTSAETSVSLELLSVPLITIATDANELVCEGESAEFTVAEYPGYTYRWYVDGSIIPEATDSEFTASTSGEYSAEILGENGCSYQTAGISFDQIARPTSSFSNQDSICFNVALAYNATSTGVDGLTLNYDWDFGDGNSSSGQQVTNTFGSAGTFTTQLTTGYVELPGCSNSATSSVIVTDIPDVEIGTPQGEEKCPSDTISLTYPDNFEAYLWNTGETLNSISVDEPGTYNITAVDQFGCNIFSEVEITNFENSGLQISSSDGNLQGDSLLLEEGQKSVNLTVSGGDSYQWSPEDLVADPSSSMITIFPRDVNTLMTVFGNDANGCNESASVRILNQFVIARTSFSPNGDGIGNDCWEITNTSDLSGCTVSVFDSRGRNLTVVDSPFVEDCVWDGTFEGTPVPPGVYYFVMKCGDSQLSQSGSIMLAR
ncbi:MAG: FG-GAP-like repeat-containing protein [Cyclobacteriaceae bacterium]